MHDVIVVGGGPSGSALAHLLSSEGFEVLILEKTKFPRYKTCAGAIPIILRNLIGDFPYERAFETLILKKGRRNWHLRLAAPIVTVKREDFDAFMLDRAIDRGAKVLFQKVKHIDESSVRTDEGSYEAKVIVGADGAASIVRKKIGINYPRWVKTVEWELPIKARDFLVSVGPGPGYAWFWPKKDTVAFGAGGFRDPQRWASKMAVSLGFSLDVECNHYIYPVWRRAKRIDGNKVLIGDAGAFASPITGAGIYSGILSAVRAGKMIERHLKHKKPLADPCFRDFHNNFLPAMYLSWIFYYMPGFLIDFGKSSLEKYYGLENCYYDIMKSVWRSM